MSRHPKNYKSMFEIRTNHGSEGKEKVLSQMERRRGDGYIRTGTFSTEVIWDKRSHVFPSKKRTREESNLFMKCIFLFNMVRKDANMFIKDKKRIILPTKHRTQEFNKHLEEEDPIVDMEVPIVGMDVNHAYWKIAYNFGIISERTYLKGLDTTSMQIKLARGHIDSVTYKQYEKILKGARLAALSTLGAPKIFNIIKDGELTDKTITVGGSKILQDTYRLIRYTCFDYMQQCKELLGKYDFIYYKTDAIYFLDHPVNRMVVKEFFKDKGISTKLLTTRSRKVV
jgi:hypothetical protein